MNEPLLIVRYSETTLKGRNRARFEDCMANNIAVHLGAQGTFPLHREQARMLVGPGGDLELALEVLRGLPGVANVSLAYPAAREPEPLGEAVLEHIQRRLAAANGDALPAGEAGPIRFRITVERKDKRYPMRSMELAAELGRQALERFPQLKVDLHTPQLEVRVEILPQGALLYERKVAGPGGLAVGTGGRAVCLLSGGIDSPVAAQMMMTRGLQVIHLSFHSYPFIGEQSREKVHDLVRFLARYQPLSRLYMAPFADIQTAIRDHCAEGLRTVLYRRMMNRVANAVAAREGAEALITGESVGQVASQTLPNIAAIAEPAAYPVLQPLIGLSKQEIMDRARQIGTYDISIQPYPDCCTLFQPRKPETRARLTAVHKAEARLPVEELVAACVERLETTDYGPEYYPAGWSA